MNPVRSCGPMAAAMIMLTAFVPLAVAEPPIELLSLGPEKAVDRDGDGLLDYLEVPVTVLAREPREYTFTFRLRGGSGNQPDIHITSLVNLEVGEQIVTRQFGARDLHYGRHQGRYEISVAVALHSDVRDSTKPKLFEQLFVTATEYDWRQFADRETYCFDDDGNMITDWLVCARRRWE